MKKTFLLLVVLAICAPSFAQNFLGMKIKKFGITSSTDQDRVNNLNSEYFMNLSKSQFRSDIQGQDFPDQSIRSMTCENSAIRLDVTVLPMAAIPNIQLNLGTSLMMNRVDGTEYDFWSSGYYGMSYDDLNYNSINFSSYSNELALDASMVYHQKLAFLHLYGGAGTNVGYTFAGDMFVNGSYVVDDSTDGVGSDGGDFQNMELVEFSEYHEMKNSIHQRVFLQAGASVIFFKRLEFGFEARRGIGYRYNTGNAAKFTDLVSAGFNLRWNLK